MLSGELVTLRRWTAADVPAVHRLCQDPEIQRWTAVPVPYTPADAESLVLAEPDPATALFAVVDRAGGAVAGSMGVLEGVLRQRMLHRGERIDTAMYARLRSDP